MIIYYLTSEKKGFYLKNNILIPLNLKDKRSFLKLFHKVLLIIGKEHVLFQKKRFPKLPEKDLKKAIFNMIPEVFPLQNPSFLYQLGKIGETFVEVNLFAWEKALETLSDENLKPTYIIPEELLFIFEEATISIVNKGKTTLLVASQKGQFLNSMLISNPPTSEDFYLFLKASNLEEKEIKQGLSFGFEEFELSTFLSKELKPKLILKGSFEKELPYLLKNINLKIFKRRRKIPLNLENALLALSRIFLMGVIALYLNLLFTSWEYEKSINELTKELKKLDSALQNKFHNLSKASSKIKEEAERTQKLQELMLELEPQQAIFLSDALKALSEVANLLPDGAKLNSFDLNENKLRLTIEAKELLETLTIFRKESFCKKFELANTPIFDERKRKYQIVLECTLK